GEESELAVDGVFVAVGQIPQNELFRGTVEMDESGFVAAGEDTKTNVPGVFAAGDTRQKLVRQLVTAAADGAVAAVMAGGYIFSL
ncbi:NAD(P)/FAD-dependent oxidoreductase, partial [Bittarella massiliensis (ex Durand et al. 2017)]